MKTEMKALCAIAIAVVLSACGGDGASGGAKPNRSLSVANSDRRVPFAGASTESATQPSNAEASAVRLYQAFYGKAAANSIFLRLVSEIQKGSASLVAANIAAEPEFSALDDSELSSLILKNLDISTVTVAKRESYDILLSALAQMFAGYGKQSRGQIILNASNLLATLESDPTWGSASRKYIKRFGVNYGYSIRATSVSSLPIFEFVQTEGVNFTLNGDIFRFAGVNADWIHRIGQKDIEYNLQRFIDMGLKVVRTWAYTEIGSLDNRVPAISTLDSSKNTPYFQYWSSISNAPEVYFDRLVNLDRLIAEAEKKNIKIIMTLTNNWANSGGMDQYNVWFGSKFHDDFYTNPVIIAAYKAYIDAIINRKNTITGKVYKEDPTILSWELANELFCFTDSYYWRSVKFESSPACNAATITKWVEDISSFIRSRDSVHMISLGNVGFLNRGLRDEYSNAGGDDFESSLALKNISFGTFHLYIDNPQRPYTIQWGIKWMADHITAGSKLGKPVILEEFGHSDKKNQKEVFDAILGEMLAQRGAGWLIWGFPVILPNGSYLGGGDSYTFTENDPAAAVVKAHAASINLAK